MLANLMTDDRTENIKRFVTAIKKVYGISDTEGLSDTIHLYLKFMEAVHGYRSNYRYSGNSILIKAKTKSPIMGAFEDENLSVDKVTIIELTEYHMKCNHVFTHFNICTVLSGPILRSHSRRGSSDLPYC